MLPCAKRNMKKLELIIGFHYYTAFMRRLKAEFDFFVYALSGALSYCAM